MMIDGGKNTNYKVANYQALFSIGAKYFEEYRKGMQSFAISSTGYERSQQTTLLGIASYFDLKADLKISIVSDNLYNGVFRELIAACDSNQLDLGNEKRLRFQRFYDHFDFIDLSDVIYKKTKGVEFNQIIQKVKESYDVIFWDVPELYKIKMDMDVFIPIIRSFDSLCVVAESAEQSARNIKELEAFFYQYGINVSGMIFNSQIIKKKKRRSFWGLRK